MINAYVLASGSKGNATLIFNNDTSILIDFGISKKEIEEKLSSIGKNLANLDYFLFTHAHSDHIKSYECTPIEKRYTLKNIVPLLKDHELSCYKEYQLGSFLIMPIKASHDSNPTCGFLFKSDNEELVYLTDTGKICKRTFNLIKNKTYYIIESNHDVEMLLNSNRPVILKSRILSYKGHLSNEDSAFYMSNLIGENTKKIVLAHLSEECNTAEKALDTYHNVFALQKNNLDHIEIKCASQHEVVELWLK